MSRLAKSPGWQSRPLEFSSSSTPENTGTGFGAPDFVVALTAGFDQGYETFQREISQGRETILEDEGRRVVLLGADLARKFDARPGDYFDIRDTAFEVIGVLEPTLMFFDTTAVIPWAAGQEFLAQDPERLGGVWRRRS